MRVTKRIYNLFLFLMLSIAATAQQQQSTQRVKAGFELHELAKISAMYFQIPGLSFDVVYTYRDSVQAQVPVETMQGSCKIADYKFRITVDSIISIQGNRFNVAVYLKDSLIVVNDKQRQNSVMQLPVLDSLFQRAHVDSMEIRKYNDSTEILTINFKSEAPYSKYTIKYDPRSYLINKIDYFIKSVPVEQQSGSSGVNLITVSLNNYSTDPIAEDIFREDQFIELYNGQFTPKPAYANYQIINNTAR